MCLRAVSLIAADWVSECVRPVSLALHLPVSCFSTVFSVWEIEKWLLYDLHEVVTQNLLTAKTMIVNSRT